MPRLILFVGILSVLSGCSSLKRYSERDVRSCVNQIFGDADGYDPQRIFQVESDTGLYPFAEAGEWTKDSLIDCLNGNRYPEFRWTL